MPGNAGGGRPPDEIRQKLRELGAVKGTAFLSNVLDGKITFSLVGICPHCKEESKPADTFWLKSLMDEIRASVDQRLKANEQALKYGLGTKDELNLADDPRVKRTIQRVAELVLEIAGPEIHAEVSRRLTDEGL